MDVEGAFEVGLFDLEVPVAEASPGYASGVFEFFVGFFRELSVLAGGGEGAVPKGVSIGVVEGVPGFEVGVAVEVLFEAVPGGVAVSIEEGLRVGISAEVGGEGVPVLDWVPVWCVAYEVDFHSVLVRSTVTYIHRGSRWKVKAWA